MNNDKKKDIIQRCIRNDGAAQMELYQIYSRSVFNSSLRIVGNIEDAEEITQDSFIKIFRLIKKYKGNPEYLEYSLRRIAINSSIDIVRKRKDYFVDTNNIQDINEDTEADFEHIDSDIEKIKTIISSLPLSYKTIITLKLIEEIPNKEIATMLKIKESTVRSQYLRAKCKILELLKTE